MKRPLTKKQLDKKVLYFAYGSNMHQPRLEHRVGDVKCLGRFSLPDYKLVFDAGQYCGQFANVIESPGETCEGVIYEITYGQLRALDYHEGLYRREYVMRGRRKLHFYISNYRCKNGRTDISMEYYSLLMLGCVEYKLKQSLEIVKGLKPPVKRIIWERERIYALEGD